MPCLIRVIADHLRATSFLIAERVPQRGRGMCAPQHARALRPPASRGEGTAAFITFSVRVNELGTAITPNVGTFEFVLGAFCAKRVGSAGIAMKSGLPPSYRLRLRNFPGVLNIRLGSWRINRVNDRHVALAS